MLEQVRNEAKAAALEICQVAKLRKGQILVVGCSTSEVTGHKVGSYSSPELGQAIYEGIQEALQPQSIYLAAQCCEHLNRAIIVEAEAVPGADICNVVPQPKAGGSFATAAYHGFQHPVALDAPEKGRRARPFDPESHRRGHGFGSPCAPQVHWRQPGGL